MRASGVLLVLPFVGCAADETSVAVEDRAVETCQDLVLPYVQPPFDGNRYGVFWAESFRGPGIIDQYLFRTPRHGGRIAQIGEASADALQGVRADGYGAYLVTHDAHGFQTATYFYRDGTRLGEVGMDRSISKTNSHYLYFTTEAAPDDASELIRVDRADVGLADHRQLVTESPGYIDAFDFGDSYVYYAGGNIEDPSRYGVYKAPKSGGASRRLYAPGDAHIAGLAVVHGWVWLLLKQPGVDDGWGEVVRVNAASGAVDPVLHIDHAQFFSLHDGPDTAYLAEQRWPEPTHDVARLDAATDSAVPVPHLQGVQAFRIDDFGTLYYDGQFTHSRWCE
jgi:hypothetical protein